MNRIAGGRAWLRVVLVAVAGGAILVAVTVFEELVTADMRWGLWAASAVLGLASIVLGARGLGAWAPCVLAAPLLVGYAVPAARAFPLFWPFVPLWLASALLGWWLARRGRVPAIAASALLVLVLGGFGGWVIPRALSAELNEYTAEPAPEIALARLDGSPYPMGDLDGKVVVLDFFATWCVPCRAELPRLEDLRRRVADRDDVVILVVGDGDAGDTLDQVAAFAASSGLDLPFVWDPGGKAHDAFGFPNIPALAVIDRAGLVRLKRVGFNAAETGFEDELERLLVSLSE